MTTDSRTLPLWEVLLIAVQVKAQKVLKKGLGIVGTVLFGVFCIGFLFRFLSLALNAGWSSAEWLINWTSRLFR